jgi:hypothetical protein
VLFRSMCGTMHVPLYQVNSIEITSPPLRRQSRLLKALRQVTQGIGLARPDDFQS